MNVILEPRRAPLAPPKGIGRIALPPTPKGIGALPTGAGVAYVGLSAIGTGLTGALIGAIVGAVSKPPAVGKDAVKGAVIGAVIGGVTGALMVVAAGGVGGVAPTPTSQ